MASSSISKKLAKLEKDLKALKVAAKAGSKKSAQKPGKIDDCTSKKELEKFKVADLKAWLTKHHVDIKAVNKKVKKTWIKLVWENLQDNSSSDSSNSESDSDSDSDSDSESDSDSD